MESSPSPSKSGPSLAESIAAAQDWWRDAGVDMLFLDEPQVWLQDPAQEAAAAPPPPVPFAVPEAERLPETAPAVMLGGDKGTWPTTLPAFREWWLGEPTLEMGGLNPRIAPRGAAGADLMILVAMPEAGDTEQLLGGPEGRLLANFALAAGLDPSALHVASALPRHMAAPHWGHLRAAGLGDVLRLHISLAGPKRLLVMGRDILPLLGNDPAQAAPGPGQLAVDGGAVPMLGTYAPSRLLAHPRLRSGFWRQWLDWTDGSQ